MPSFHGLLAALSLGVGGIICAGGPHRSLPSAVIPDSLGVNIHFTDPRPGEMEMIAAAGFKWVRMDFTWAGTERAPGQYDFSAYERLLASLEKHQMHAIFILDYGNPLYATPGDQQPFTSRAASAEFREAFARWAVAAVKHFAGRGCVWEMWNEPNGEGFWKPPATREDYIALARATGQALRDARLTGENGEAFIGPATATIDMPFLEACFQAGLLEFWDAISVHPYRQHEPESVGGEYHALKKLIARYAPKDKIIPIISGEWGYSSVWKGMDEPKQAAHLARSLLTNVNNGIVLSIWYDWHDDGTDPGEPEHHFGMVNYEYHKDRDPVYDPKPAYLTARALTSKSVASLAQQGVFAAAAASSLVPVKTLGMVPLKNWTADFGRVIADGDARVASRQTLVVQGAPENLSPGGGETVSLTYQFDAGWKFLCLPGDSVIPPLALLGSAGETELAQPFSLGLWVFGDGQNCTARLHFTDATSQVFQADGPRIDWKGWRYLTFALQSTASRGLAHWGGADDGVVHYPIKWDSLFLLDSNKSAVAGEILLSAPMLIY